jgi:hypothetical protein
VPGAHGVSSNIIAPDSPERERSALLDVPGTERSPDAPEGQERPDYPTPALKIRAVVLAVDGRGGSILLADGVRMARISKSPHVGVAAPLREHSRGRAPSAERLVDDGIGGCRQDALGKRIRLSEQRPRPEG